MSVWTKPDDERSGATARRDIHVAVGVVLRRQTVERPGVILPELPLDPDEFRPHEPCLEANQLAPSEAVWRDCGTKAKIANCPAPNSSATRFVVQTAGRRMRRRSISGPVVRSAATTQAASVAAAVVSRQTRWQGSPSPTQVPC